MSLEHTKIVLVMNQLRKSFILSFYCPISHAVFGFISFLKAPLITPMSRVLYAAIEKCRQEEVTDMLGKSAVSSCRAVQK